MKLDFCVSERQIIYHNLKKNGFVLFYNLFTEKLAYVEFWCFTLASDDNIFMNKTTISFCFVLFFPPRVTIKLIESQSRPYEKSVPGSPDWSLRKKVQGVGGGGRGGVEGAKKRKEDSCSLEV